jgi:hypothetical protein
MLAVLLVVAASAGSEHPDQSGVASEAAVLAVRGDRAAAEARPKPLLAGSDPDWSTIYVAACLAIESGDLDRAAAFSKRLRQRMRAMPT